jgi:UDP-N-acetylmuramyl pentapeptide phosphotransferase/UDP-N-acetylglucosamine-1-phosphate transferase
MKPLRVQASSRALLHHTYQSLSEMTISAENIMNERYVNLLYWLINVCMISIATILNKYISTSNYQNN